MKNLFYLLSTIVMLHEISILICTGKYIKGIKEIKSKTKKKLSLSKHLAMYDKLRTFLFIWLFIGFFSSNWILFLIIFLLISIPKNYNVFIKKITTLLTLGFLILMLLNKFQLHINIYDYILNLIM